MSVIIHESNAIRAFEEFQMFEAHEAGLACDAERADCVGGCCEHFGDFLDLYDFELSGFWNETAQAFALEREARDAKRIREIWKETEALRKRQALEALTEAGLARAA